MKKLLGSTALVVGGLMAAPAMAADPIKIGVGGYYSLRRRRRHPVDLRHQRHVGAVQGDLNFQQEGEIHFNGRPSWTTAPRRLARRARGWIRMLAPLLAHGSMKRTCSPSATGAASSSVPAIPRPIVCTTARRRP